jgi:hypothetical protein
VKDVFFNPSVQLFVSYSEKGLHAWNPETTEQVYYVNFLEATGSKQVSCVIYSERYHLYFAMAYDFKMLIFNENFKFLHAICLEFCSLCMEEKKPCSSHKSIPEA